MIGNIIIFRVLPSNSKLRMNKFCREFYGYKMKSNYGRYTYEKKGFLDNYPYIKIQRGVIIARSVDAGEIISFLESYNAEIFTREISLLEEDLDQLKSREE